MSSKLRILALSLGLLGALCVPALAGNTVVLTPKGDVVLPISRGAGTAPAALDNTNIGATTPAAGTFVPLTVDNGTKTATAASGAATLNKNAGVITTESLSTAAGGTYTLTLTDSTIAAADQVFVSVFNGSNTGGMPDVTTVTPGAGSVVIVVQNVHATTAFNGTLKLSFLRLKN